MPDDHIVTLRPPVWALLLAVAVGGCFYIGGKHIESEDRMDEGMISVSGEGRVSVAPDIAEMSFGVQTGRQPTAKEAMRLLAERMTAIQDAALKAGVEKKDLTTESFWLNPIYDWTERGGQVFRGFEASQSLRVKLRDLDKVSDVLEAATSAGANQAGGVQFTVDDPEAKRAEARAEAITQARRKAERIAGDLGVSLGDIRGFNEDGGSWGGPVMMRAEMATGNAGTDKDEAAPAVPLPAGEQEIRVNVNVTYELE
jgi:uncharacterized protein